MILLQELSVKRLFCLLSKQMLLPCVSTHKLMQWINSIFRFKKTAHVGDFVKGVDGVLRIAKTTPSKAINNAEYVCPASLINCLLNLFCLAISSSYALL
jgi:hypothetical protein